MYEARDKAFREWLEATGRNEVSAHERDLMKRAFIAGWKARKHEQYTALLGVSNVVER